VLVSRASVGFFIDLTVFLTLTSSPNFPAKGAEIMNTLSCETISVTSGLEVEVEDGPT
jgi:hypothetical protein